MTVVVDPLVIPDPPAGYCPNDFGGAVRVEIRTTTQQIIPTDDVVRVTYAVGGKWDAGGTPWFAADANPCRVEIETDNGLWNPVLGTAGYNVQPLSSTLLVWVAAYDPGLGIWTEGLRYPGTVIARVYVPKPGPVGSTAASVVVECTDNVTDYADAAVGVLAEQQASARLTSILPVKGVAVEIAGPFGPTIGRTDPTQGLTVLAHANDVAQAARHALLIRPATLPGDPSVRSVASTKAFAVLGRDAPVWALCRDPENPVVIPGVPGEPIRACLTAAAVVWDDAGYRNRVQVARAVCVYTDYSETLTAPIGMAPGFNQVVRGPFQIDVGDVWEWYVRVPTLALNGNPGPVNFVVLNQSNTGQNFEIGRSVIQTSGLESRWQLRAGADGPNWLLFRQIIVPAGATVTIGASAAVPYRETLQRLAGSGPIVDVTAADPAQATFGRRAVTGLSSPIARQTDLVSWATAALGWVPTPRFRPAAVQVAVSPSHVDAGARQFLANARPGDTVAVRYSTAQPAVDSVGWAVSMTVTLEPQRWAADVTLAPQLVTS